MADLPPCGLYRTRTAIAEVPAGKLVYFHNHGEPGPGVYLPKAWSSNRARFHDRGVTLPNPLDASALEPVPAEGLYRVAETFTCCDKNCRTYSPGSLVQLGYNGEGDAILFVPEWTEQGLVFPVRGTAINRSAASRLQRLDVPEAHAPHTHPAVH